MTLPVLATDVRVAIDGTDILHGVDLRVEPGEFVALLGANGSGKSTLVRACLGVVPLASGSVELFGHPVDDFGDRSRLGYVPQRSTASTGVPATVREVVTSGRLARHRWAGWPTGADRRAAEVALSRVGLSDRAGERVSVLSGGQQQRVMIARALACEPDLLVMDEPTAGVDFASQETLADLLGHLSDEGISILMVAHELGPIAPHIDRRVTLRDGREVSAA